MATRTPNPVGPGWPPPPGAYDYLSRLSWRDWAWEGLRRNPTYQAEACERADDVMVSTRLEGGAYLTRMQEPMRPAEAWALWRFRRPNADRIGSASRLAARGRRVSLSSHR
jgi:Family of unknown function (DUF6499)